MTVHFAGDNNGNDNTTDTAAGRPSFSAFGRAGERKLLGQRISENTGSEYFQKLLTSINKLIKDVGVEQEFRVVPLPRETHRLHYSGIVIVRDKAVPLFNMPAHKHVVAQVLILEATGDAVRSVVDTQVSHNPIQITLTSEDVFNDIYQNVVRTQVAAATGVANADDLYLIDPIVIPRDLNVEDEQRIRSLVSLTTTAVNTRTMFHHANFKDWDINEWLGGRKDARLPVTVESVEGSVIENVLSQPIHADTVSRLSLDLSKGRAGRQELNGDDTEEDIAEAMTFVELVPVNPNLLDVRQAPRGEREFRPSKAWMPRLNIVNVEQSVTRTPAGIVAAILPVVENSKGRRWALPLRPKHGPRDRQDVNFQDVGALNIQANLSNEDAQFATPVDTTKSDFDDRAFGIFLDSTVTPEMSIGIHCADSGTQAYYTSPFAAVARGTADQRRRAANDIVDSWSDATGGIFREMFDPNRDQIVDGPGERFHMGYWYNARDQRVDVRAIDQYLPVANMLYAMRSDMNRLIDWCATRWGGGDEATNLAEHLQILQALTRDTLTVTGMGLGVTLTSHFVDCVVRSAEAARLPLVSRTTDAGMNLNARNVVSNYAGSALFQSNGFSRGYETRSRGRAYRPSY